MTSKLFDVLWKLCVYKIILMIWGHHNINSRELWNLASDWLAAQLPAKQKPGFNTVMDVIKITVNCMNFNMDFS